MEIYNPEPDIDESTPKPEETGLERGVDVDKLIDRMEQAQEERA